MHRINGKGYKGMDIRENNKDIQAINKGDFVRISYRYYAARFIAQGIVRDINANEIVLEDRKHENQLLKISTKDIDKIADYIPARMFK